ncbi:MAG: histidine phosphatase family protein, partial [Clostridia bacterium]|nr:histidine phosphatase family protein [Clostridia bacterium]
DFAYKQWHDRDLAAEGGESLNMVRARFTQALEKLVAELPGHTIAIGTHGMALSTVYNHYDESFDYEAFLKVKDVMPRVVRLTFEGGKCVEAYEYNI